MPERAMTVVQVLPALQVGGVERGTVEVARELVARGNRAVVVSAGGSMVDDLLACGAEHVSLPVGAKRLSTIALAGRLARIYTEVAADIVHVRSRLPAWVNVLAMRKLDEHRKPGLVTTVHGPYSVNRYSAVMTRADRVIAISGFIRDYLLNHYPIDPERIRLIHRGIDPEEFPNGFTASETWESQFRSEYSLPENTPLIAQIARITRWKGQAEFLHVIAALKHLEQPVIGLIAGGAEKKQEKFLAELKTLARQLGVEEQVRFLGSRSDTREILSISKASVSLTLEPEAFGRTTLESVSLGTPVVGYAHGGTAEILGKLYPDGLCQTGDTAAAAGKLRKLLSQDIRIEPHHEFQRQSMLDSTLAVYKELVM